MKRPTEQAEGNQGDALEYIVLPPSGPKLRFEPELIVQSKVRAVTCIFYLGGEDGLSTLVTQALSGC